MFTRRVFLKSTGMAMLSLGFAPSFLARTAAAANARRKLLIAIFQRGAVDGLNMIVPFGEPEYYRLRPSIAIPRPGAGDATIDLDGFFGLHPRMAALKPLWADVRRCGKLARAPHHAACLAAALRGRGDGRAGYQDAACGCDARRPPLGFIEPSDAVI
jgi:uncharacterized protein (DUF1501 family)